MGTLVPKGYITFKRRLGGAGKAADREKVGYLPHIVKLTVKHYRIVAPSPSYGVGLSVALRARQYHSVVSQAHAAEDIRPRLLPSSEHHRPRHIPEQVRAYRASLKINYPADRAHLFPLFSSVFLIFVIFYENPRRLIIRKYHKLALRHIFKVRGGIRYVSHKTSQGAGNIRDMLRRGDIALLYPSRISSCLY